MTTPLHIQRLSVRLEAERVVRQIVERAEMLGWKAKTIRRELREAYWRVFASRSVWYGAVRRVVGTGILEIRDARQRELVERGPRARRRGKAGRRVS